MYGPTDNFVTFDSVQGKRRLLTVYSGSNIFDQECGEPLYADFFDDGSASLDQLEAALHQTTQDTNQASGLGSLNDQDQIHLSSESPSNTNPTISNHQVPDTASTRNYATAGQAVENTMSSQDCNNPKYLAICVTAGGIYKTLHELDVSGIKSDSALFFAVKNVYEKARKSGFLWRLLFRPLDIEFIQVCGQFDWWMMTLDAHFVRSTMIYIIELVVDPKQIFVTH